MDDRNYQGLAGRLVLSARSRAGMTQAELAQAAGVTQTVVSAYETGRRQPTLPTLCRLLAAAGFAPSVQLEPLGPARQHHLTDEADSAGPASTVGWVGPVGSRVATHREAIRDIVTRHGADRPRVFGSAARGEDHQGSDLDLLIRTSAGFGLLDQAAIIRELTELLGIQVDVITEGALHDEAARQINAEAVPL
jgi:uncharacterized protein